MNILTMGSARRKAVVPIIKQVRDRLSKITIDDLKYNIQHSSFQRLIKWRLLLTRRAESRVACCRRGSI